MPFKSGAEWNGNSKGRPKNPIIEEFREAIIAVEEEQNNRLMKHYVRKAFKNDDVLKDCMKKILPDKMDFGNGHIISKEVIAEKLSEFIKALDDRIPKRGGSEDSGRPENSPDGQMPKQP